MRSPSAEGTRRRENERGTDPLVSGVWGIYGLNYIEPLLKIVCLILRPFEITFNDDRCRV